MPNKLRPCRPKGRWQMVASPKSRELKWLAVALLAMLTSLEFGLPAVCPDDRGNRQHRGQCDRSLRRGD